MIQVPVADDHRVERGGVDGEIGPVPLAQLAPTLEKSAIQENPGIAVLQEKLASGHAVDRSEGEKGRSRHGAQYVEHRAGVVPTPQLGTSLLD